MHETARMLASHLGVGVSGERGLPNRGGTSFTTEGCLQTVGCFLLFFFVVVGLSAVSNSKSPDPQPKTPPPQKTPETLRPSQKLFVQMLESKKLTWQANFYDKGLVEISATPALWKRICLQDKTGQESPDEKLFTVLSSAPEVVQKMGAKLQLPEKPKDRRAYPRWWRDKVSLKISMEFEPDESSIPVLTRNLELAVKRLKMVEPREGEAHLELYVFPKAEKPRVNPEQNGVTLVIPATTPINPADLGLQI